ncbi:MAG: hypothetical protein U0324_44245 [Polyangiales bacterium]
MEPAPPKGPPAVKVPPPRAKRRPRPELPAPVEMQAAVETVRITVIWTGVPGELDDALRVLGFGLGPGLARQIVDGALGAEGDLDEECHEHLTVVRHARGTSR